MSGNVSNVANSLCQISIEVSKELDSLADRAFQLQKHARSLQEKLSVKLEEKGVQVDTIDSASYTVLDTVPAHQQKPFAFKPLDKRVNWNQLKALNFDRIVHEADVRHLLELSADLACADVEAESVYNTTESNLFKVIRAQQLLLQFLQDRVTRQQRHRRRLEEDRAALAGGLAVHADVDLAPVATGLMDLQQQFAGLAAVDMDALFKQVRLEERVAARNASHNARVDDEQQL